MGNSSSRIRMRSMATAKLILLDGELKEFSSPVKVCTLLQENTDSFICNSDEMDFDKFVTAISGNKELQLGQLYFELPLSWLTQRLQAEDMASLAVKASAALNRTYEMKCGCYGPKKVDPELMFYDEDYVKVKQPRPPMFENPNELVSVKKKTSRLTAKLNLIYEEDQY